MPAGGGAENMSGYTRRDTRMKDEALPMKCHEYSGMGMDRLCVY